MTEADLFRTRDHVPDFDNHVAWYRKRSSQARSRFDSCCDVTYGEGRGASLDLFFPKEAGAAMPIHLFIHGGYWRMFDKSDFSFVADTVCGAGGIAAIMNYDLMPRVRMETIVGQVRQCAIWLTENARSFGGDAARFSVSGHSAGGHLASLFLTEGSPITPMVVLALSGIYDLSPLKQSFLQPDLNLTDAEIDRFSPLFLEFTRSAQIALMVGGSETRPFHEQAAQLERKLQSMGCIAEMLPVPGANHMSIVSQLGNSESLPGRALRAMVQSSV